MTTQLTIGLLATPNLSIRIEISKSTLIFFCCRLSLWVATDVNVGVMLFQCAGSTQSKYTQCSISEDVHPHPHLPHPPPLSTSLYGLNLKMPSITEWQDESFFIGTGVIYLPCKVMFSEIRRPLAEASVPCPLSPVAVFSPNTHIRSNLSVQWVLSSWCLFPARRRLGHLEKSTGPFIVFVPRLVCVRPSN